MYNKKKSVIYTKEYVMHSINEKINYHEQYGEPLAWTLDGICTLCSLYQYHLQDLEKAKAKRKAKGVKP
jgi:hypothetical protein